MKAELNSKLEADQQISFKALLKLGKKTKIETEEFLAENPLVREGWVRPTSDGHCALGD